MTTTNSSFSRRPARALLIAAAACAVLAPGALAQSGGDGGGAPVRVKRPVRKPVIDLERDARRPRPGQVVAGDPGPAPAPAAAAPTNEEAPGAADPIRPATPAALAPDAAPVTMTMMSTPAPLALNTAIAAGLPVKAIARATDGPPSQVEWRAVSDAGEEGRWQAISADTTLEGRIEVRTGMAGSALLEVDGRTSLRIGRLSRVRVERLAADGREELLVRLERGKAEIQPRAVDDLGLAVVPVRVLTPGASLVRRVAVEVTHDAFHGTRETMLSGE